MSKLAAEGTDLGRTLGEVGVVGVAVLVHSRDPEPFARHDSWNADGALEPASIGEILGEARPLSRYPTRDVRMPKWRGHCKQSRQILSRLPSGPFVPISGGQICLGALEGSCADLNRLRLPEHQGECFGAFPAVDFRQWTLALHSERATVARC